MSSGGPGLLILGVYAWVDPSERLFRVKNQNKNQVVYNLWYQFQQGQSLLFFFKSDSIKGDVGKAPAKTGME
jgi:hypothetical protein